VIRVLLAEDMQILADTLAAVLSLEEDLPARRRGDGLQLRAHGPHRLRTPGVVGGLTSRLAQ
jgi:hypothetical protein